MKCAQRSPAQRRRFLDQSRRIAQASEERVRARIPIRAPLSPEQARWYEGHILKELAGLLQEIRDQSDGFDKSALEMVFSAMLLKFSKQRGETSEELVSRRLRKGLVTEFFVRKCRNFRILYGQYTWQNLDNCDVNTEGVVEACKFNADGA